MLRTRRHRLARAAVTMALLGGMVFMVGAPAKAAVQVGGSVMCAGGVIVTGVWVDAASGADGWAARTSPTGGPYYYNNWRYNLQNGESYRLAVGCGGTQSRWASSNVSPWVRVEGLHLLRPLVRCVSTVSRHLPSHLIGDKMP
jgi:hypothetical protein